MTDTSHTRTIAEVLAEAAAHLDAANGRIAELETANTWLFAEVTRLSAAVCDLAMAMPSPQVARLAQATLHWRACDLEPVAMRDPRQLPVLKATQAAAEKMGGLAT